MATIRLFIDELEEAQLPRVCMRCGAPAVVFKRKRFSWGPGWVMALIAVGALCSGALFLVVLVILVPLMLQTMHVPVPLCKAHRRHWRLLNVILLGGLSIFGLAISVAVILALTGAGRGDWRSEVAGPLALGGVLFLVCLLFPAAFLHTKTIRAVEITPASIRLTNVSREFVRALDDKLREGVSPRREAFLRGDLAENVRPAPLAEAEKVAALPAGGEAEMIRLPPVGQQVPDAGPSGDLGGLIDALKDPRGHVRWDAARRLGQLGAGALAALPHLAELLDDPDGAVRRAAQEAMDAIDPGADDREARATEAGPGSSPTG